MTTTAKPKDRSEGVKKSAEEFVEKANESINEGLDQAQETIERVSTQAQQELRKVGDEATSFVRENPGVAIAGAVGVGLLIGLALRPRY